MLVLGGIQLRADGSELHLAATDMELSLRASLEARVADEGTVVVPGRLLLDIARSLAGRRRRDRASPRRGRGRRHRRRGRRTACTPTRARTSRASPRSTPTRCTVDRDALVETIARVGRSASRDESRPVLTGILVRFEPGKIVMAATDSYRLAVKETPVTGTLPELEAIIPARALQELARIAAGADDVQLGHAGEPRRVRRRRHVADHAAHRRPVPELPPAAARAVRARARRCRARRCSTSSAACR